METNANVNPATATTNVVATVNVNPESRGNLEFLDTYTPTQFKRDMGVDKIDIKRNPQTGKLFFQYGGRTGAVSASFNPETAKSPMISYVKGEPRPQNPDGKFFIIHEEGTGGAPVVATL